MSQPSTNQILIASYLEVDLVETIRGVDPRLTVVYEPALLRSPRYAADHTGGPYSRSPDQEDTWRKHLADADILFDFDQTHREDLPELAPKVRWIQATSAGIGQFVKRMRYDERMPDTIFTTASGVHAIPLTEFCVMAMLGFNKGLLRMVNDQRRKHWERYAGTDLVGRHLTIVGVGAIGRELARIAKAFGMVVTGVKRSTEGVDPADLYLDELLPLDHLHKALEKAEYLVLATPHTPETEGFIGRDELAMLPKGAMLINIGRGPIIDQTALVDLLRSGHLGAAALDVFTEEPLPESSPLWTMPNVLVSPHSASTSDRENGRITDLFCENLQRYLRGETLLNVLDVERMY